MIDLVIFGAGGHGRVCAEVAQTSGRAVSAFCDPGTGLGAAVNGIPVIASDSVAGLAEIHAPQDTEIFVAIGDNDRRMALIGEACQAGFVLATLIHPSAVISPSAEIGPATVVMANCVVNANSRIRAGCILNTACSVDHDNVLADGVQICPGVRAAGNVHFGEKAFVGTGAVLVPGVRVGAGAYIGAGCVVAGDVSPGEKIRRFLSRPERT